MSINPETAVSYAALILADEGLEITADKLQALLKAAGVEIEPIWSTIFSKALKDKDIKQILTTVQASGLSPSGNESGPMAEPDANDDGCSSGSYHSDSDSASDIGMGLFD